MNATLLILAAGMGSRYGGLKQVDGIGPNGETIIDYSVFDAIRAGFRRVVFVIRRDVEEAFMRVVADKLESHIDVGIAFQELDSLPAGVAVDTGRKKPWGTAHALWCAKTVVDEPFVVLNADDFYGEDSFRLAASFLQEEATDRRYALIGFPVDRTLSEHGPVSRGICEVDARGNLKQVVERLRVQMTDRGPAYFDEENVSYLIPPDRVASMNMWALFPSVFDFLERDLLEFFDTSRADPKREFLIPTVFNRYARTGALQIAVVPTSSDWFGLTFSNDKESAAKRVRALIDGGHYPQRLWS